MNETTGIRFAKPAGDTFREMRDNAVKTELWRHGDMVLVWVNEGDLYSLNRPAPVDLSAEAARG